MNTYRGTQASRLGGGGSAASASRSRSTIVIAVACVMVFLVVAGVFVTLKTFAQQGLADNQRATVGIIEPTSNGFNPEFERRIDAAEAAANESGQTFITNSGWRTAEEQQQLLDEAVIQYGTLEVASRWVLPPELSAHVQGLAIDVGPPATAAWLDENGWQYGLCRAYDNEPWHFEPLADPGQPCPPREPDASVLTR